MVYEGLKEVDLSEVRPGDTVRLRKTINTFVSEMSIHAKNIGCKLMLLNYGEFFFKDIRYELRESLLSDLLDE